MSRSASRSVLITGGFGFIGSHLIQRLLGEPDIRVHVVDNMSTSPIDLDAYLRRTGTPERLSYDLCTVAEYFSRSDLPRFDEIYHLASVVGPVGVLKHGGKILASIVSDTYAVANYAIAHGAKLCDVSTSEVYGGGRDGYCSEKDTMIIPARVSVRLEYAVAKLGAEVAMMNMAKIEDLQVVIVRPFNVAGPRQATGGGFVLPRFINQALKGAPLTVYGDGTMIRAFTHVEDIVDGIVRAMRMGQSGTAYNVGNPANKTTILNLAKLVLQIVGSKSRIEMVDPKKLWGPLFEEANDKYPDADRAMKELEWMPRYGLPETIVQSVEYISENRRD